MKKGGLLLFLILLLLILPLQFTLASLSIIELKTAASREVSVKMLYNIGEDMGKTITPIEENSFDLTSDANGNLVINYDHTGSSAVQLAIRVIPDMEAYKYFKNIPLGKRTYIDLTTSSPVPVISDIESTTPVVPITPTAPVENDSSTLPVTTPDDIAPAPSITTPEPAQSTTNQTTNRFILTPVIDFFKSKMFLIIIVVIVIVFLLISTIAYVLSRYKKSYPKPESVPIKRRDIKYSEIRDNEILLAEKRILYAERQLKEAQDEIARIKSRKLQIAEAERKIREDQYRLRKLRGN